MSIVALIDYGSGNLRSAAKAMERVIREQNLKLEVAVTNDADVVRRAERVVLPGVGAFADCRAGLDAVPGMHEVLDEVVIRGGRPFLGICVGMQLMAERGLEHGVHAGLGWLAAEVGPLTPADASLKIPHMGWNDLIVDRKDHPLLADLPSGRHVYFVHSYHMACRDPDLVLARAEYGGAVAAMVGRDNLAGVQFHPEKSQAAGLTLIGNFLRWRP